MPAAAVETALVEPPLGVPGLGSQVSIWLGPPPSHTRMQARCFFLRSSARASTPPISRAAASAVAPRCRKRRRSRRRFWSGIFVSRHPSGIHHLVMRHFLIYRFVVNSTERSEERRVGKEC